MNKIINLDYEFQKVNTDEEKGNFYNFKSILPIGEYFELRRWTPPKSAQPIIDEQLGMCVGYSVLQTPGLWRIYDIDGNIISLEEAPLESPLFDPLDIIFIGWGFFKILRAGTVLFESGIKSAITVKLSQITIGTLRGRLKIGLSGYNLKMTETAAKHMLNPGRYVPIQIMEKTIRFGKRFADPRKSEGIFRYETTLYKLVENKAKKGSFLYKKYILEVVVREKDWTVVHFLYK